MAKSLTNLSIILIALSISIYLYTLSLERPVGIHSDSPKVKSYRTMFSTSSFDRGNESLGVSYGSHTTMTATADGGNEPPGVTYGGHTTMTATADGGNEPPGVTYGGHTTMTATADGGNEPPGVTYGGHTTMTATADGGNEPTGVTYGGHTTMTETATADAGKSGKITPNETIGAAPHRAAGVIPVFSGLPNSSFRSPYHKYWETDCSRVFKRDMTTINATTRLIRRYRLDHNNSLVPTDEQFSDYTRNCSAFRRDRKYPTSPRSWEEEEYPLAYIITTHKVVAQVERLLRAIYQPQNIYCIHPDSKSPPAYQEAIRGLVSCFENVFIPSKVERVQYAGYSRLQADINCMEDLLQKPTRWKYLMNLCGQDFPLKTNLETVRQLKAGRDHNFVRTALPTKSKLLRTRYHYVTRGGGGLHRTKERKTPPPYNFTLFVGSAYYAVTREFVDYVIHDVHAIALLEWSEDTKTPDEHYWSTLQEYPGVPGGYPNAHELGRDFRFVKWRFSNDRNPGCVGKYVRSICVFGMGYLKNLLAQPRVFANKFDYGFDPVAIQCLEEMLDYRQRYPETIDDFVDEFPITKESWVDDPALSRSHNRRNKAPKRTRN